VQGTTGIQLTGSTWGHERGFGPLLALNELHQELFPCPVNWDIRSLKEFGDHSMFNLTDNYDLVVFDHPFIGEIAKNGLMIPLNKYLGKDFLEDQKLNSIGNAYASYVSDGNIYALPIDVAGHVSARRMDLFEKYGLPIPGNWDEVMALAANTQYSKGSLVAIPGFSVDLWCFFVTLLANKGLDPYSNATTFVTADVGAESLEYIKKLAKLSPSDSKYWNPIQTLDAMSTKEDFIYCPALFGYSNYSQLDFRKYLISFGELPGGPNGSSGGILGGAGIGVSAKTKYPTEAVKVAEVLSSAKIQAGLYVQHGGQPGHRTAWNEDRNNLLTSNFYRNTLSTLDKSYLRPRFSGFVNVQTLSSDVIWDYVNGSVGAKETINALNLIYAQAYANQNN
jgi:multiple sugar transport system substrate-binding protein